MKLILLIAAGGAIGSVARYMVGLRVSAWFGTGFPWGTLAVNIIGATILGFLIEMIALRWSASVTLQAFFVIGILGGFTTFSTFSLEVVLLLERGEIAAAGAYALTSVVVSVGALFASIAITRGMLT